MQKGIKSMRLAFLSISIVLLLFTSCADKCKKIICYNKALCIDGICGCLSGFEGEDCSKETREKFLGVYNVTDNCTVTGNVHYTVNIGVIDTNVMQVAIANFNNDFSNNVRATISGAYIEIPPQTPDADGKSVSGTGIFSGGYIITWSYTILSSSGVPNDCNNSVWEKQ